MAMQRYLCPACDAEIDVQVYLMAAADPVPAAPPMLLTEGEDAFVWRRTKAGNWHCGALPARSGKPVSAVVSARGGGYAYCLVGRGGKWLTDGWVVCDAPTLHDARAAARSAAARVDNP